MIETEKTLIQSLKNGEEQGYETLYNLYSQKLYTLAYKMCRNTEDAQDVVQATFVQAFSGIAGFKGDSQLYTWLYVITKNQCLKLNQKRSRISSLDALVKSASQLSSQPVCATVEKQNYIDQVKEGCLLGLLNCLSFHQRIAFILNVLLDVKTQDVAQILGKTETAARLLVFRARHNIMDFLCENCSLYNTDAACSCENLIDFSLKQGWIDRQPIPGFVRNHQISAADIENEISQIKKLTLLYGSIGERQCSEHLHDQIKNMIKDSGYRIFSSQKVK